MYASLLAFLAAPATQLRHDGVSVQRAPPGALEAEFALNARDAYPFKQFSDAFVKTALAAGNSQKQLWIWSILAGAFYYLYNEVAFLALGRVNPVTHAVGNTIKRVVIIIASVIAFVCR